MPVRDLHLEAKRRRSDPLFGLLTRAAGAALAQDDIGPLADAVAAAGAADGDALFMARVHGISGLLARLSERSPARLGESLHAALAAERAAIGERGARLAEDVAALGRRAERAGLPFAPLKGAVLAPTRYRDLSLRPAADVDLLAPDGTFEAWRRALSEAGYREAGRTLKHATFVRDGGRVPDGFGEHPDNPRPVDLHDAIREPMLGRIVDVTEAVTARLTAGTLHGVPALLPDDDALLIHLLLHAGPHAIGRGVRLVQLADLGLLRTGRESPRAAGGALGEIAWGVAQLAARSLPGCLPAPFLEGLSSHAPSDARRHAWLSRPGLLTGEAEETWLLWAEMPLCATPRDALRRVAAALPERVALAELYGAGLPYPAALARYVWDRIRPPSRS